MKLVIALLLLTPAASAQLVLHAGSPTSPQLNGLLALADTLTTTHTVTSLFLVNTSSGTLTVPNVTVSGSGFTLLNVPALPQVLPPGSQLAFTLSFAPTSSAAYSANLQTGTVSTLVTAKGIAALSLNPSNALDFGTVPYGSVVRQAVTLSNATGQPLAIPQISIKGPFHLDVSSLPLVLQPGDTANVFIQPSANMAGSVSGTLAIDSRTLALTAVVGAASPPVPSLSLANTALQSGMQNSLRVTFDAPALTSGTGTVQLVFQPNGDPAAIFLATGKTMAGFSFAPGDTATAPLVFQTGTLAGTVTISAQIGDKAATQTYALPPAVVTVDRIALSRGAASLDVQLSGFDNTRSASTVNFIFFDPAGKQIGAPVSVAANAGFQQYFTSANLGGLFALDANFPVMGDPSKIDAVTVEIINSAGQMQTPRTKF